LDLPPIVSIHSSTIAWAFWLLVLNPEALQKARDEVLEHLGKDWVDAVAEGNNHAKIIPEESTTYENLQKCHYLDAITRETLRLYPPAASTRYSIYPDASYGNYKIGEKPAAKKSIPLAFCPFARDHGTASASTLPCWNQRSRWRP
jgi:hypothetical protein